jgi:hypothetical protein
LPPHSTHLMQPFNIIYFQPVKYYHRKIIDEVVRLGAIEFPLVKFFSAFGYIRAQIFKRETIISIFEQTRIYSLNTEKIVESLYVKQKIVVRIYQISDFASDPVSFSFFFISEIEYIISQKVADIEISGTHIYRFIIQYNMNWQILTAFEKIHKNTIIGLYASEQAAQ